MSLTLTLWFPRFIRHDCCREFLGPTLIVSSIVYFLRGFTAAPLPLAAVLPSGRVDLNHKIYILYLNHFWIQLNQHKWSNFKYCIRSECRSPMDSIACWIPEFPNSFSFYSLQLLWSLPSLVTIHLVLLLLLDCDEERGGIHWNLLQCWWLVVDASDRWQNYVDGRVEVAPSWEQTLPSHHGPSQDKKSHTRINKYFNVCIPS